MKAIQLQAPHDAACVDVPIRKRKNGEALIEIKSMGICGSDVSAFQGKNPMVRYPLILGHELAGIVREIDENEQDIKVGDRVVVDPYISCGHCYPCSLGRTNCCADLKVLGTQIDGGMCQYLTHPVHLLHKMPDELTWDVAPITETMCISLHTVRRAMVQAGEKVAIFGAGPVGFLAALICKDMGAEPILIDIIADRLAHAQKNGIQYTINSSSENLEKKILELTDGEGVRAALEVSGANEAISSTLQVVSHAGRVVFTGWPKKGTLLETSIITKKELDVRGSRTANREFDDCLKAIASGRIPVAAILTATCGMDDIPQMLQKISDYPQQQIKVVALN